MTLRNKLRLDVVVGVAVVAAGAYGTLLAPPTYDPARIGAQLPTLAESASAASTERSVEKGQNRVSRELLVVGTVKRVE